MIFVLDKTLVWVQGFFCCYFYVWLFCLFVLVVFCCCFSFWGFFKFNLQVRFWGENDLFSQQLMRKQNCLFLLTCCQGETWDQVIDSLLALNNNNLGICRREVVALSPAQSCAITDPNVDQQHPNQLLQQKILDQKLKI